MDRLMSVWEFAVGRLILGTCLYNAFCIMMGARCPFLLAEVGSSIREFDLITIGQHAIIRGSLYCRSLLPRKLVLAPVVCKTGTIVDSLAVVLPGCTMESGSVVQPLGVLLEGATAETNAVYSGNPAVKVDKTPSHSSSSISSVKIERVFSVLKAITLLVMFWLALIIACVPLFLLEFVGGLPRFRYTILVGIVSMYFIGGFVMLSLTVVLKWLLVGRVEPEMPVGSYHRQWRAWVVDSSARIPLWLLATWFHKTPVFNLWYRLLGMRIPIFSSSIPPDFVAPSAADLVVLNENTFAFQSVLKTEQNCSKGFPRLCGDRSGEGLVAKESRFGAGCSIGLFSVCGPGVVCASRTSIGAATFVSNGANVPEGFTVFGNPPRIQGCLQSKTKMCRSDKVVGSGVGESLKGISDMVTTLCKTKPVEKEIACAQSFKEFIHFDHDVGYLDDINCQHSPCLSGLVMASIFGLALHAFLMAIFLCMALVPAYELFALVCCNASVDRKYFGLMQYHGLGAVLPIVAVLLTLYAGFVVALLLFDVLYRVWLSWYAQDSKVFSVRSMATLLLYEHMTFSSVVQEILIEPLLSGTVFIGCLYRLMGAKVGSNVYFTGAKLYNVHNLEFGDGTVVDTTECRGHIQNGGVIDLSPIGVGSYCTLQPGSILLGGDRVDHCALVGPRTKSLPGQILGSFKRWHGAPARPFSVSN